MAPHIQRIGVIERRGRKESLGIICTRQKLLGLFVRDNNRSSTKAGGPTDVVGMRVAVDQMRDWFVCDFSDGFRNGRHEGLWRIYHNHTVFVDKENGLIGIVRYHVEVFAKVLNSITLRAVDCWALRGVRHVHVLADANAYRWNPRHVFVCWSVGLRGRVAGDPTDGAGGCQSNRKNEAGSMPRNFATLTDTGAAR